MDLAESGACRLCWRSPLTCPMRALLTVALLALSGCDSADPVAPSGPASLTVDFTTQFDDDLVRVELDDALIYEERLTTNDVLGLAERATFSIPDGRHRVRVEVAGRAESATFEAGATVFVGVSYDSGQRAAALALSDDVFCCYD